MKRVTLALLATLVVFSGQSYSQQGGFTNQGAVTRAPFSGDFPRVMGHGSLKVVGAGQHKSMSLSSGDSVSLHDFYGLADGHYQFTFADISSGRNPGRAISGNFKVEGGQLKNISRY